MNDASARKMACVLGLPVQSTEASQAHEPPRLAPYMDFSEMFKTSGSR